MKVTHAKRPCLGRVREPCPLFACYTLAFAVQLSTVKQKKNLIVVEKCQHILAVSEVRFVDLSLPALGDVGEHSVSVDICRAA